MNVKDQNPVGQPDRLPQNTTAAPDARVALVRPRRWKGIHRAPSRTRKWLSILGAGAVAALLAAAALTAAGTPARAGIGRCDTTRAVYTGVRANAHIWMPASTSTGINCSMSYGQVGGEVKTLQTALNKCYGKSLSVDGQFGPRTRQALMQAQRYHGISTGLGQYGEREAWTLRFWGIRAPWLVCARLDAAILD